MLLSRIAYELDNYSCKLYYTLIIRSAVNPICDPAALDAKDQEDPYNCKSNVTFANNIHIL